ncbi:GTP-binding GUF1-like protein [Hordeum vulgare]|nr:GTP-binding GUF1-like protein [Hordeum vulgare]
MHVLVHHLVVVVVGLPARTLSVIAPGSVVAHRLAGLPMPLIQCDDCTETVLRLTSSTRQYLGWVFCKCNNDGVDEALTPIKPITICELKPIP